MSSQPHQTVPGLDPTAAAKVVGVLEPRLAALLDLQLTLKHVHWNVVGPGFLSVHEMLDEQVEPVRDMVDAAAERIRTLGGVPLGTPQAIVDARSWDDYGLHKAAVFVHLKELDRVYDGVIADHRRAIEAVGDVDPVTEDLLIGQTGRLEMFQWFVRSFLERAAEGPDRGDVNAAVRAADRRDSEASPSADRPPTPEEERAAERAADDVDLGEVGEHYEEMSSVGARAKGEGRI